MNNQTATHTLMPTVNEQQLRETLACKVIVNQTSHTIMYLIIKHHIYLSLSVSNSNRQTVVFTTVDFSIQCCNIICPADGRSSSNTVNLACHYWPPPHEVFEAGSQDHQGSLTPKQQTVHVCLYSIRKVVQAHQVLHQQAGEQLFP